jgi:DNA-directed RNA polymerase specialized sigma54-like protein
MLDKAIVDVQVAYSSGDEKAFWASLKKLVIMVREPDERAKLDQFISSTEHAIRLEECNYGYTVADRLVQMVERKNFLMGRGMELFDMVLGCLDAKGYLKKNSRNIQSNLPSGSQLFDTRTCARATLCCARTSLNSPSLSFVL